MMLYKPCSNVLKSWTAIFSALANKTILYLDKSVSRNMHVTSKSRPTDYSVVGRQTDGGTDRQLKSEA